MRSFAEREVLIAAEPDARLRLFERVRDHLQDKRESCAPNGRLVRSLAAGILTLPDEVDLLQNRAGKKVKLTEAAAVRVVEVLLQRRIVQWRLHSKDTPTRGQSVVARKRRSSSTGSAANRRKTSLSQLQIVFDPKWIRASLGLNQATNPSLELVYTRYRQATV
jgi:hypothetical protein